LSRIQAKNFNFTFSVASCKLSATALNENYSHWKLRRSNRRPNYCNA
jgi:hypothetical protein